MKVSQIIAAFEADERFKDDPEVKVLIGKQSYAVELATELDPQGSNAICLKIDHTCPKVEGTDRYYWNGKLLQDLSRGELEQALLDLVQQHQMANAAVVSSEIAKKDPKPAEGAKA